MYWFEGKRRSMPIGQTSKASCHAETGYHWFVVEEAFDRYVRPLSPLRQQQNFVYFLAALKWIHKGTTTRQMDFDLGMTDMTFRSRVYPLLSQLARTMDIVKWSDRLNPLNHTRNFPYYVTSVVDTAPIAVCESVNREFSRLLYAPKYGMTCLKLEVTCSLMGHLVDFKFPAGL